MGNRKGGGEELEALELPVTFKPGKGSGKWFGDSERRRPNELSQVAHVGTVAAGRSIARTQDTS